MKRFESRTKKVWSWRVICPGHLRRRAGGRFSLLGRVLPGLHGAWL